MGESAARMAAFTENEPDKLDEAIDIDANYSVLEKLKDDNRKKILVIDSYINKLWLKRVWTSACINICLVVTALYTGTIFVFSIVIGGVLHIIDKYLDYNVHKLYQKKDYAKYG